MNTAYRMLVTTVTPYIYIYMRVSELGIGICACLVHNIGSDFSLVSTHDGRVEPTVGDGRLKVDLCTAARSANPQRRTGLTQANASLGVVDVVRLRHG